MKKILCIVLCLVMVLGMCTTAFAADDKSTLVKYEGTANETYTVTVPAELAPSGSGTVSVAGTWASNRHLTVSADTTVTLTNSINSANTKTLDITFEGIDKVGNNEEAIQTTDTGASETVSVSAISDALFGTWSGSFNYQVSIEDVVDEETGSATFKLEGEETVTLSWKSLKKEENGPIYFYDTSKIHDDSIGEGVFRGRTNLISITIPSGVTSIEDGAFQYCSGLTSITLPDALESIGDDAFYGCSITSITLPAGVTSIGDNAFISCYKLASVTYKGVEYTSKSALTTALTGVTVGDSAFAYTALGD